MQIDALTAELTEARKETNRLAAFARDILAYHLGSIDGPEIEHIGLKHGVLLAVEVAEPCSEECECAEVGGIPGTCYRIAAIAKEKPREPTREFPA